MHFTPNCLHRLQVCPPGMAASFAEHAAASDDCMDACSAAVTVSTWRVLQEMAVKAWPKQQLEERAERLHAQAQQVGTATDVLGCM